MSYQRMIGEHPLFFDGEHWIGEQNVCQCCKEEQEEKNEPYRWADRQFDHYGIYAGKMCRPCFKKRFRQGDYFDPDFAGEALEAEDY